MMQKPALTCENAALLCDKAATCGACTCVNLPYSEQLAQKNRAMAQLFAPLTFAGNTPDVRPIIGMAEPLHYRNKVMSPFAPGRKNAKTGRREILTGMYAAGTHRLVNTDGCVAENAAANAVVVAVRRLAQKYGMQPYDEDSGSGFLRHVVVRVGHTTGEMLVVLVTNGREFAGAKNFCQQLVRACPNVTTIVQNINMRQTNVVLGTEERTLYGPGFVLDRLCGLSFRISGTSFYQVNAVQTEVLYRTAVAAAQLTGTEAVIDAYCGTGTIGLVAARGVDGAPGAARIIGVDTVPAAIADAAQNARHNGIANAEFHVADATAFMEDLARERREIAGATDGKTAGQRGNLLASAGEGTPQGDLVLMMDPPRAGSTPEFIRAAAQLAPARIVYISCNPDTLVRDLHTFATHHYLPVSIQPVDMFPHTPHVECVTLLTKICGKVGNEA